MWLTGTELGAVQNLGDLGAALPIRVRDAHDVEHRAPLPVTLDCGTHIDPVEVEDVVPGHAGVHLRVLGDGSDHARDHEAGPGNPWIRGQDGRRRLGHVELEQGVNLEAMTGPSQPVENRLTFWWHAAQQVASRGHRLTLPLHAGLGVGS
jgi:hypothetical protein